ncbi:MAG: hypothetical protein ACM674_07140 [Bacteroidales bacterium]|uniref:hypothetical protein n=1 Tax=Prevotellamassilia timonensis TaxID=1852370 RepID=UPI003ACFBA03
MERKNDAIFFLFIAEVPRSLFKGTANRAQWKGKTMQSFSFSQVSDLARAG